MLSLPQTIVLAHVCGSVHTTSVVPHRIMLVHVTSVPQRIIDPHAVWLTSTAVPQRIMFPQRTDWLQWRLSSPIVVHGDGVDVNHPLPVGIAVLIVLARSIAPFGLIDPTPFLSESYSTPASSWMPT